MVSKETKKPEKQFRAGNCTASVWKNELTVDNKKVVTHSVAVEKSYKDKDDNWQSTNSFNKNELPKAILVLQKSYEYLALKNDEE